MIMSDKTYCINIVKVDYPLRSMESQTYDYVYNPGNYKENDFHSTFSINVQTENSKARIGLIGSFYANLDHCAVLEGSKFIVLMDDEIAIFELQTISVLQYKSIGDETYFYIYPINSGYLIHGELPILRLNKDLEQMWDFCGSDIWTIQDGTREAFRIVDGQILLEDWNGIKYTLDMDGNLIA